MLIQVSGMEEMNHFQITTNIWQGDINTPTETVTDPIDNNIQYTYSKLV